MPMQPGIVLILYLGTIYILAMVIFCQCVSRKKTPIILITEQIVEVPFVLQEGQTILGVMDTAKITCFCVGNFEEHVHDEEEELE